MLIEATDAHFADLIAGRVPQGLRVAEGGVETPRMLAMLRGLSAEVSESFQPNAWLIVEDGEVVGLCSLVRTPYVEKMFGPEMYALFIEVKKIFDPLNIFNPGKKVGLTFSEALGYLDLPSVQK